MTMRIPISSNISKISKGTLGKVLVVLVLGAAAFSAFAFFAPYARSGGFWEECSYRCKCCRVDSTNYYCNYTNGYQWGTAKNWTEDSTCHYCTSDPTGCLQGGINCADSSCSLSDVCSANTLVVNKTCTPTGCGGTTYTCDGTTHTECQAASCGGAPYNCTQNGGSWGWGTGDPDRCGGNVDGWYDTGSTRTTYYSCGEVDQKKQEYRNYNCTSGSCGYGVNSTKWVDTATRYYNTKTVCNYGSWGCQADKRYRTRSVYNCTGYLLNCPDTPSSTETGDCGALYCANGCTRTYSCSNGACGTYTENCAADTTCTGAGVCDPNTACSTGGYECKDSCSRGKKQYRCDGSGSCSKFWQWTGTISCNPFSCSVGSCNSVCSAGCGADAACDGKNVGSSCGPSKECDSSCQCVSSCEGFTKTACDAKPACAWCGGDSSCKPTTSVQCQPLSCSGASQYCTNACSWTACAGTASACYCSGGSCAACAGGYTCSGYACVQNCPYNCWASCVDDSTPNPDEPKPWCFDRTARGGYYCSGGTCCESDPVCCQSDNDCGSYPGCEDCNAKDGCVGTTYVNYYCDGVFGGSGSCKSTSTTCDSRCYKCGDGSCDSGCGESYSNCPQDCCESDCTAAGDTVCHSACSGYNGCGMNSACDGKSSTAYVCCDGGEGRIACCEGACEDCGAETSCSYSGCSDDNTQQGSYKDYWCVDSGDSDYCDFGTKACYADCAAGQCCLDGSCVPEGTCSGTKICSASTWIDHCGDGTCGCGETVNSCGADCPVEVTSISLSSDCPKESTVVTVRCGSSPSGVNCVGASITGGGTCTFQQWEGSEAVFSCSVGSYTTETCRSGNYYTATCYVQTEKCVKKGTDKTASAYSLPSGCSQYATSGTCNADSNCAWCEKCSSKKTNHLGYSACVDKGTCTYSCRKDSCGAECDADTGGCGAYCGGTGGLTRYYGSVCQADCTCTAFSSEDCDDGNSCTADSCAPAACTNTLKCDGSTCSVGSQDYCSSCVHCGDGICNCDEDPLSCPADNCVGCGDGVCSMGETQESCGSDCRTTVDITPSMVAPGMTATLTIEFWDTRYTIDTVHPVTISLTIGGLPWENCIHNKPITDAASCAAYGCSLTRETGHFKITAECVVPDVRGTQTVRVEPKFESAPVSLNPAAASITISETESTVQAAQLAGKIMNLLDAFLSNPSRFLDLLFIGAVHL